MPLRSRTAFIGAAVCAALLILTWLLAFHVGIFERADQAIFKGFYDLHHPGRLAAVASHLARLCSPTPWVYFAAVPVLVALARKRPRLAVTVGAILLGANVTTQLLKPLLAVPRASSLLGGDAPVGAASWPSGHATAAMSLALSSVLAAPGRMRPALAALGAAFAVAVSYSFLSLGWHYPSDVFGGFLVAGTWTLLGVGAQLATDVRIRRGAPAQVQEHVSVREALAAPAIALLAAGGLACVAVIVRPHAVVNYARLHTTFVVGAGAIGVLGLALATGIMLTVRR